ncbi:hypothetical protein D9619_011173 [Psilocybe cf. subviscida]|uniref:Uncharacterized protein n=1 Tax=Psilocybe cf. subviscida TaxID=2480587 RepID=A0A8H5F537_9AGAR|nr:hypothetical protein D9619_011173 [Psilocybe cf. subviscida]
MNPPTQATPIGASSNNPPPCLNLLPLKHRHFQQPFTVSLLTHPSAAATYRAVDLLIGTVFTPLGLDPAFFTGVTELTNGCRAHYPEIDHCILSGVFSGAIRWSMAPPPPPSAHHRPSRSVSSLVTTTRTTAVAIDVDDSEPPR